MHRQNVDLRGRARWEAGWTGVPGVDSCPGGRKGGGGATVGRV